MKDDRCHPRIGMTESCELQQDLLGLSSRSTTLVGPEACVHVGLKLPF